MDETLFMTLYFGTLVFAIGACVGSFLNVVIYRMPAGKSVVSPRSQCKCGAFIAWYDNIPILSWFILGGKCRHCGEHFSIRYPMVELGTALVFLGLWIAGGWPIGIVWMIFAGMMIPAALIDLDTMEIPDTFSIGGFIIGVILSVVVPSIHGVDPSGFFVIDGTHGAIAALLGAFVGSGLILWVALVAEALLKKEAMGFGDVKLMGAIGAFCGWQGSIFAFFGGSVLGCLLLLFLWPFMKKKKEGEEDEGHRIPFGPALAAGAVLYLLVAKPFVTAYFSGITDILQSF
ncbi:prepilin peptidase [Puniceicoccales bacterium CK1056]|uniref:Prepilin peptidase n=1 Tax=Oceanipulchritudo coccoides TaxID=2706888 RepID=A0A6B2LXN3_9BACT|nr:A24 family peptidase [Oceanipulchritudo coccoides]NDV61043.1 prepilin peptidase [Oceanipulchritudo coccoides]